MTGGETRSVGTRVLSGIRPSSFSTERTITVSAVRVIAVLLIVYLLAVGMMALARVVPVVFTAPFVIVSLSFVPGALFVLALASGETRVEAAHLLYAFGTSLLVLMLAGALVNVLLPLVGVSKPLMPVPLAGGATVAVGLLAVLARWRNPSGTITLRIPPLWSPTPLALLLLPLLSVIGVNVVNLTGNNVPILVALLAVAVMPVAVVRGLSDRWHSLAIWTVALAILYHKSLWKYAGFGGRPHGIKAWQLGRWSPGVTSLEPYTSELVQNGVLFPMFARLNDLFILTQYEVVNPFFVSFIPLAVYVAFRQYVRADIAFLGAATFAFVHPFYLQYPTAGRAATPVLFLVLFGVAISNTAMSRSSRAVLATAFLTGIVVTHYGTSYYVAAALCMALVFLSSLRLLDAVLGERLWRGSPRADGGVGTREQGVSLATGLFSSTTVLFFMSAALGWYFYVRGGWKFELLPKHVYENLTTLIGGPTVEGRTTARVTETYTSASIEIAKYVYILLALLIAIGFLIVYLRRVFADDHQFEDHYLVIATALFGLFGVTIVFRNWGGGRPMMISFSFTTVFAALAAVRLAGGFKRIVRGIVERLPLPSDTRSTVSAIMSRDLRIGSQAFAVLLVALFVLNTGVAAATVFGGFAPSNVPSQANLATDENPESQVTVHRETDITTHVWMVQHVDSSYEAYGDTFTIRQFDWYRPDVTARTPPTSAGYTAETKPVILNVEKQQAGTQPGYLMLTGHNLALDHVWMSKFYPPAPTSELSLDQRNKIYTTGESHIYFYTGQERSSTTSETSDRQDDSQ